MVNKISTNGTPGTNAPIDFKKSEAGEPTEVGDEAQPGLADTESLAEVEAGSEAESISVTTAELDKDNSERYTDHPKFDKLFLDETKSSGSVIPFDNFVDKILLFDLRKSSPWTSRGAPAKPILQASRIAPFQNFVVSH